MWTSGARTPSRNVSDVTDEEAAVIDAAYRVDQLFYALDPGMPTGDCLAALDAQHQAIIQLEAKRKAAEERA